MRYKYIDFDMSVFNKSMRSLDNFKYIKDVIITSTKEYVKKASLRRFIDELILMTYTVGLSLFIMLSIYGLVYFTYLMLFAVDTMRPNFILENELVCLIVFIAIPLLFILGGIGSFLIMMKPRFAERKHVNHRGKLRKNLIKQLSTIYIDEDQHQHRVKFGYDFIDDINTPTLSHIKLAIPLDYVELDAFKDRPSLVQAVMNYTQQNILSEAEILQRVKTKINIKLKEQAKEISKLEFNLYENGNKLTDSTYFKELIEFKNELDNDVDNIKRRKEVLLKQNKEIIDRHIL